MHLNRQEVLLAIHSNDKHLRKLIADGRFPPGIQETAKGEMYWNALDVACYLWLRARGMVTGCAGPPEDEE